LCLRTIMFRSSDTISIEPKSKLDNLKRGHVFIVRYGFHVKSVALVALCCKSG